MNTNVHQLDTKTDVDKFEEFWKQYPHHPARSKKAASRILFMAIVAPGGFDTRTQNKDSGTFIPLHLEATPEEIVDGAKRYWKSFPAVSQTSFKRDTSYVEGAQVWLNGGRWED